jgi:hypothetical protein
MHGYKKTKNEIETAFKNKVAIMEDLQEWEEPLAFIRSELLL